MKAHMVAQATLVRMLHDPAYADAVREAPRQVLRELPHELADALARIDQRALRRDVHRRERTLGELCKELPCATTLAVVESGRVATLMHFYGTAHFHKAIAEGTSLVLALGRFLEDKLADGTLRSPHLAAVLAVELASARARRDVERASPGRLWRAAGVEPLMVPAGTLAVLHALEQHRFRLSLVPAWTVAKDAPMPMLPALGVPSPLCAVTIDDRVSLVEIEAPLYAVLVSLATPRTRAALLDEATLRLEGDRAKAEAALEALIEDELVISARTDP